MSQPPTPVQEMAYMRAGPYFYVQGGKVVHNNQDFSVSPQLYSLDLSTSWNTGSPAWRSLSSGPAYNLCNGVSSPDNKTLTTMVQAVPDQLLVNRYDIDSNKWSSRVLTSNENLQGTRPIVDPTTGLIYINGVKNMIVLNPQTMTTQFFEIADTTMPSRTFLGAVYHPGRRSILYFGGFEPAGDFEGTAYVTEYSIGNNGWSTFTTKGRIPPPRADHCMSISEDGSKIIVFGGRVPLTSSTSLTTFSGNLYILDISNATWTEGLGSDPRLYAACVIVGDQFVVWGGFDGVNTVTGPPIVYTISNNSWGNSYTPPAYYTSPRGSDSNSDRIGIILGGSLGSLFIIALAGIVYLFRKRRSDKKKYKAINQQRSSIISQTELIDKSSKMLSDNNSLSLLPVSSTKRTVHTPPIASPMGSQHSLIRPVARNPQDKGNGEHTIDYDPISYVEANPQPILPSNPRGVFYIPRPVQYNKIKNKVDHAQ
ncbi:hypothetical protein FBU30_002447 [Linnemannia zychae]|nr:hypothetical protein FBU30_002447 [Linnemannia zychae]